MNGTCVTAKATMTRLEINAEEHSKLYPEKPGTNTNPAA